MRWGGSRSYARALTAASTHCSKPARKRRTARERRAAATSPPEAVSSAHPPRFPREVEQGAVEYKLQLAPTNSWRQQQLLSQLKWRLHEGQGSCVYMLGVSDDGTARGLPAAALAASLAELRSLALALGCEARVVRTEPGLTPGSAFARVAVAPKPRPAPPPVRVALAGASGAGKSTLLAALLHARLDDGGGGARACVAAHPHELLSGRTSAIRHRRLAYGDAAQPLPPPLPGCGSQAPEAGAAVWLCELPAPPAFARTGLFGLACAAPHVALLCVAPSGVGAPPLPAAAAQHLAAAMARGVPVAVVLTCTDQSAAESATPLAALLDAAASATAAAAATLLPENCQHAAPSGGCSALEFVKDGSESAQAAAAALRARMPRDCDAEPVLPLLFPALRVSCVTGEGLSTLHAVLASLAAAGAPSECDTGTAAPFVFHVEEVLVVANSPGTGGSVAAGACASGACARGDALWLGPVGRRGAFAAVRAASIHAAGAEVPALGAGIAATLALRECTHNGGDSSSDAEEAADADADDAEPVGFEDVLRSHATPAPPAPNSLLARAIAQRKGLVLLARSPGAPPPRAVWTFDAVLVPLDQRRASGGGGALRTALASLQLSPGASAAPHCSVHCGSVRQEARLVALAPASPELAASLRVACLRVRAAAAAAVLDGSPPPAPPPALTARLAFAHRPQWLAPGAPLLMADSTGALVASGLVLPVGVGLQ